MSLTPSRKSSRLKWDRITFSKSAFALSATRPLGFPVARSRSIFPPGGSGVFSSMPAFLRFCIVVFEAQNPFPGWSFSGAFAQGRLYGGNRTQIAIHHAEMHAPGFRGMRVGVNEPRQHSHSAKIHLSNARSREIHHIRVFPNGEKSASRYGYSFRNRLSRIHCHDVAVMQNEFWFFLFERKKRKSSKRAEEFAASRSVCHSASSCLNDDRCGCYAAPAPTSTRCERQQVEGMSTPLSMQRPSFS